MKILKFIRLDGSISTGLVIKILFNTEPDEVEHALHVLLNGSVRNHEHPEESGITEGYRKLNLSTFEFGKWEIVGARMPRHIHGIPYCTGIQIVEGIKKGPGKENWKEELEDL